MFGSCGNDNLLWLLLLCCHLLLFFCLVRCFLCLFCVSNNAFWLLLLLSLLDGDTQNGCGCNNNCGGTNNCGCGG